MRWAYAEPAVATRIRDFKVDLHVHTCLSPCADLSMTPAAAVTRAREVGLDGIAVCDHNSAENVGAARRAAEGMGLEVLGGIEITSSEEVHVLGIFGTDQALHAMQGAVYDHLPGENDEAYFGQQVVMNENDEAVDVCDRLLIGATTMGITEIVSRIKELGGIVIASHVDRDSYSLIGQLGIVPQGLPLDALGLSFRSVSAGNIEPFEVWGLPLVSGSDAHFPSELGRSFTAVRAENASFAELAAALAGQEGRSVTIGVSP